MTWVSMDPDWTMKIVFFIVTYESEDDGHIKNLVLMEGPEFDSRTRWRIGLTVHYLCEKIFNYSLNCSEYVDALR